MCFYIEKCVCVVMIVLVLEWIFLNVFGDRIYLVNYWIYKLGDREEGLVSKVVSERIDFRFREYMLSC